MRDNESENSAAVDFQAHLNSFLKALLSDIDHFESKYDLPAQEVLHDFRVGLRQGRSLLYGVKPLLPKKEFIALNTALKNIFSHTSKLRELEAFIAKKHSYLALGKSEDQPWLLNFFSELSRQGAILREELKLYLHSADYVAAKERWHTFMLNSRTFLADKDLALAVSKKVFKKIRRLIQAAFHTIGRSGKPQNKKMHKLRLLFKKTRYLCELFTLTFPLPAFIKLQEHIRPLQAGLGEYQDLLMQEKKLEEWLFKTKKNEANQAFLKKLKSKKKNLKQDIKKMLRDFKRQQKSILNPLQKLSGEELF